MKYKIKFVHPIYTGGGIYVYVGSLEDGNFFITSNEWCSVAIVNASPYVVDADGYHVSDDVFYHEWIDSHLVDELTDGRAYSFAKKMLKWIIKNQPKDNITNYLVGDMEGELSNINVWFEDYCGERDI